MVVGEEGGEVGLDGLDGGFGFGVEVATGGAEMAAAAEVFGDGGGGEGGGLVAGADAEAGDAGLVLGLVEEEADLGGGDGAGDVDGILDFALGDAGAAEVACGEADEGDAAAEPGGEGVVGLALEEDGAFAGVEVEAVVDGRGVDAACEEVGGGAEGGGVGAGVGEAAGVGDECDPEGLGGGEVDLPFPARGEAVDELAGAAGIGDDPAGDAVGLAGGVVVDDAGGELGDGVAEGVGESVRAAAVEEEGASGPWRCWSRRRRRPGGCGR